MSGQGKSDQRLWMEAMVHLPGPCRNEDCHRAFSEGYRLGYEKGREDGFDDGERSGYADGASTAGE